MIYLYCEGNKNAKATCKEVEKGLQTVENAQLEIKRANSASEAGENDVLVACIAKKTLGSQLPYANTIRAKKIYIAGAGLNLGEIAEITRKLGEKKIEVLNSICLRRQALIAGFVESNLDEAELARCRAFGERIALGLTGQRAKRYNEKNRIRNYTRRN